MATKKPTSKKPASKKPTIKSAPTHGTRTRSQVKAAVKKVKEKPAQQVKIKGKNPKEIATAKGEPYVAILSMDIDPENLNQGAFELDWNDKFIANLIRAGYKMKETDTDAELVDRWFQNICRNIVLETWEQDQAMNNNRLVKTRDIGDGFSEVS